MKVKVFGDDKVLKDPAWEAVKESAVFIMRGTVEEICKQDLEHFQKTGKEYIFVLFNAPTEP